MTKILRYLKRVFCLHRWSFIKSSSTSYYCVKCQSVLLTCAYGSIVIPPEQYTSNKADISVVPMNNKQGALTQHKE